jgi:hypothetical protein
LSRFSLIILCRTPPITIEEGQPAVEATVKRKKSGGTWESPSTTTDHQGFYEIPLTSIEAGNYCVKVTFKGYQAKESAEFPIAGDGANITGKDLRTSGG